MLLVPILLVATILALFPTTSASSDSTVLDWNIAIDGAPRVPSETYLSAQVQPNGNLEIATADGRAIVVPKRDKQSTFSTVRISPDRTAVGATAEYQNCCTSYDIALQLFVYSQGKGHWFDGVKLAIFHWDLADAGRRVAFQQESVHSGCWKHYELRDIHTERLIDSARTPLPCGQFGEPDLRPTSSPAWVKALEATPRTKE